MNKKTFSNTQQGATLILALVLLLVLTLAAVGGMSDAILQEKLAGTLRDSNQAFQNAESNLRIAEQSIRDDRESIRALSPFSKMDYDDEIGFYSLQKLPDPGPLPLQQEGGIAKLSRIGGDSLETGTANNESFQVRVYAQGSGLRSGTTANLHSLYVYYASEN